MLLLAWTQVTHNSNHHASVHVNVAQDLPTFHSSLHFKKIITSQPLPSKMIQTAMPSEVFQSSLAQEFCSKSPSLCTVHNSDYLAEHPDCVLHEKGKK